MLVIRRPKRNDKNKDQGKNVSRTTKEGNSRAGQTGGGRFVVYDQKSLEKL